MDKWEYKVLTFNCGMHDSSSINESRLNEWGEMGWELVSAIREPYKAVLFMKRLKK